MVFSVQNIETGEFDHVQQQQERVQRRSVNMNVDEETGEVNFTAHECTTVEPQMFDEETGEPLDGKVKVRYMKHDNFHIPRRLLRGTKCEEFNNVLTGQYQDIVVPTARRASGNDMKSIKKKSHYDRDDYINMEGVKNEIISGHKKANYRMFLVPTLFFFNIYLATFITFFECVFHFWAHKKNDFNMNKEVYFRSPLHVLTSQFCGRCRSEAEMDIKIFDRLNSHMRKSRATATLKDVSKVIS